VVQNAPKFAWGRAAPLGEPTAFSQIL